MSSTTSGVATRSRSRPRRNSHSVQQRRSRLTTSDDHLRARSVTTDDASLLPPNNNNNNPLTARSHDDLPRASDLRTPFSADTLQQIRDGFRQHSVCVGWLRWSFKKDFHRSNKCAMALDKWLKSWDTTLKCWANAWSKEHMKLEREVPRKRYFFVFFFLRNNPIVRYIFSFDEVDHWFQHNEFIRRGYRDNMSMAQIFKSLFQPHNELLNIWTHLLSAVWFCKVLDADVYVECALVVALPSSVSTTIWRKIIRLRCTVHWAPFCFSLPQLITCLR